MGIYHGANPLAPCPRLARQIGYNGRSKKPKLKADLGNHIGSQIVQLSLSHESRTAEEKDEPQEMKAKKLKQTGRTIHDLTTDCQFFLLSCHAHCNLSFEQNVNRDVESRKQKNDSPSIFRGSAEPPLPSQPTSWVFKNQWHLFIFWHIICSL